ncbi:MAG: N-formylglutamate amidohydrolase [Methanoregulaceae archaeon]|nr:N-formylglutamate amidohydrolase [Methanoregulaceae archaeon]
MYPFIISVPHGGTIIPLEVSDRVVLSPREVTFYSDPGTREIFNFRPRVAAFIDTDVSRVVVDLNRPPYHLAPKYPDGAIKSITGFGTPVYRDDRFPDINLVHRLMVKYFFPYHEQIDRLTDEKKVMIAFDCHSMLPQALPDKDDPGNTRPLICLGNNGDLNGAPRPGILPTCPEGLIQELAQHFRSEFGNESAVLINRPYAGGFISISHRWHRDIPWVQIEVNRGLYERETNGPDQPGYIDKSAAKELHGRIWDVLSRFWDNIA